MMKCAQEGFDAQDRIGYGKVLAPFDSSPILACIGIDGAFYVSL